MERGLDAPVLAVGLMSGTSLDGIDAALLTTDGVAINGAGARLTEEYDPHLRRRIRDLLGARASGPESAAVERALTLAHARAVRRLLDESGIAASEVRVIGFHGQTLTHIPAEGFTWQLGDGALLARETDIDVVCDFRSADMGAGGEGAPLAPVFHRALAVGLRKPVAVLNIGGVANVTWIGGDGRLLAFDTGPGNALIDDWVASRTGAGADIDGFLARAGQADQRLLRRLLSHPYFDRPPPKSLDRNDFAGDLLTGLSVEDGAATLTAFTADAVARAAQFFPAPVKEWLVTGGGRRNPAIMEELAVRLAAPVRPVEDAGWDGDALEAQAFAFMAVRSLAGLPLSFPGTTGVAQPLSGGTLIRASRSTTQH